MRDGTAPCGLRYGLLRAGRSAAWCALSIGCGTRDEGAFGKGIAHFVEHTLFKGTLRKKASAICSLLERLGGELNAYTDKEEIVLYATTLKEDLWKAVALLLELATEATFPDREVETERGVVLDEIIAARDNPPEEAFDLFEECFFAGHPLARRVLGSPESVSAITPVQLRDFTRRFFVAPRMALSIVADCEEQALEGRLLELVSRTFPAPSPVVEPRVCMPASPQVFSREHRRKHHEANTVMGTLAPSLHDMAHRPATILLANLLGGPASNALLNQKLREKEGWVYSVECAYNAYADAGLFAISFGCDHKHLERCTEATRKVLQKLCDAPLAPRTLAAWRRQLVAQMALAAESSEAQCLSMGKSLLSWGRVVPEEEMRKAIEAVTAENLQAMARRLFAPGRMSVLHYL